MQWDRYYSIHELESWMPMCFVIRNITEPIFFNVFYQLQIHLKSFQIFKLINLSHNFFVYIFYFVDFCVFDNIQIWRPKLRVDWFVAKMFITSHVFLPLRTSVEFRSKHWIGSNAYGHVFQLLSQGKIKCSSSWLCENEQCN